jgi:hypothetical protein
MSFRGRTLQLWLMLAMSVVSAAVAQQQAPLLYVEPNILYVVNLVDTFSNIPAGSRAFTITISGPKSVKMGEQIRVHVVLTSTTATTWLFAKASPDAEHHYTIHVYDKDGRKAPRTVRGQGVWPKPGNDSEKLLKFGGVTEADADHTKIFDLHVPGKYAVQLSRSTTGNWRDESVFSNRIAINVTE